MTTDVASSFLIQSPLYKFKRFAMCFSATASFSAGIILTGIGIAAIKRVQEPKQYPFACIPLFFAAQQMIEGLVWLSLSHPDFAEYQRITPYAYLIFAQAIWPIWVPFSFMWMEADVKRRKILTWLTWTGVLVAVIMMYNVFSQEVTAQMEAYHIHYNLRTPSYYLIFPGILYFFAIIGSPFLSTVERSKWLAWSSMVSFLVSILYFKEYLISVWCFFAAIISVAVLIVMDKIQTNSKQS